MGPTDEAVALWRGLQCLYLEAPSSVVADLKNLAESALTAAERRGAERALRWSEELLAMPMEGYVSIGLAALFPEGGR